jgi:hypothetical protein
VPNFFVSIAAEDFLVQLMDGDSVLQIKKILEREFAEWIPGAQN